LIEPWVVLTITLAVGAGALVLRWLARVADIPSPWTQVALVALVALTIAVAATAGAAHRRGHITQYPYTTATTVGGPSPSIPDMTGLRVEDAIAIAQSRGLEFIVIGRRDASSVIVRQDPPPGAFVPPGTEVQLFTGND
jgi:hypothetical protein